jgi:hypothetical protein
MDRNMIRLLRAEVKKTATISDRAVNKRIKKAQANHPTASREDALLLVAAREGIAISGFCDEQRTLDRVNQWLERDAGSRQPDPPPPRRTRASAQPTTINIGRDLAVTDPLLPQRVIQDAKMMAERVYPKLYLLENSLREVIMRVMRNAHGKDWWQSHASPQLQKKVAIRKNEESRKAWHGKRGAHEIYYADFADLKGLVNSNYDLFRAVFPDRQWFDVILDALNPSRNVSSHHNPVASHDLDRIEVNFRDWQAHIAATRHLIPE